MPDYVCSVFWFCPAGVNAAAIRAAAAEGRIWLPSSELDTDEENGKLLNTKLE